MSTPPNNPQVFPITEEVEIAGRRQPHTHGGLTLRDHFAAQALAGMCANPMALNRFNMDGALERLARDAYGLADALLRARET